MASPHLSREYLGATSPDTQLQDRAIAPECRGLPSFEVLFATFLGMKSGGCHGGQRAGWPCCRKMREDRYELHAWTEQDRTATTSISPLAYC
jgi:hypothetical protein